MFCPKCKYEYNPTIFVCPDCNIPLVETLEDKKHPQAAVTPDDSWVSAGLILSQLSSELAKGSLDSNNIPSVILPSHFDGGAQSLKSMLGASGRGGDGNVVLVPREYRDEAILILEAVLGDDLILPDRI